MKSSERLEMIIREVQEKGQVRVAELSRLLGCSEVTIRSDIKRLDEQGVLKRTYGGAVQKQSGLLSSFAPGEFFLNADKKLRIARRAFQLIEDRDSVMIADSTTCCYLAGCIKECPEKRLAVVTNSLYVAAELSSARHVDLFLLGGHVVTDPPVTLDSVTVAGVGQYHVGKAFIGANGINLRVGLTSVGAPQMEVKREMLRVADQTWALADSSKFGGGNLFTVCPMEQVTGVITDSEVAKEQLDTARRLGVRIEVV